MGLDAHKALEDSRDRALPASGRPDDQEDLLLAEGLSLPTDAANEIVQWIYRWSPITCTLPEWETSVYTPLSPDGEV